MKYRAITATRGDTVKIPVLVIIPEGVTIRIHLRQTAESDSFYNLSIVDGNVVIPEDISAACLGVWGFDIELTDGDTVVDTVQKCSITFEEDFSRTYGAEATEILSDLERKTVIAKEFKFRKLNGELESIASNEDMTAIQSAESARVTAEGLRVTAEQARTTAEGLRVTADQARTIAEGLRVTAEQGRVTTEQGRVTAEGLRVTAEQARVTAEGLRVTADQARTTAEGLRVTAEQGRVTAEGARVIAEGLRVTAEQARVIADGLRVTAEQARVTAEGLRVTAESGRVNAEVTRSESFNKKNPSSGQEMPLAAYPITGALYYANFASNGNLLYAIGRGTGAATGVAEICLTTKKTVFSYHNPAWAVGCGPESIFKYSNGNYLIADVDAATNVYEMTPTGVKVWEVSGTYSSDARPVTIGGVESVMMFGYNTTGIKIIKRSDQSTVWNMTGVGSYPNSGDYRVIGGVGYIVTADYIDHTVKLINYDTKAVTTLATLSVTHGPYSVVFIDDDNVLVANGTSNTVVVIRISDGSVVWESDALGSTTISAELSEDKKQAIVADDTSLIKIINIGDVSEIVRTFKNTKTILGDFGDITINGAGNKTLVVGSSQPQQWTGSTYALTSGITAKAATEASVSAALTSGNFPRVKMFITDTIAGLWIDGTGITDFAFGNYTTEYFRAKSTCFLLGYTADPTSGNRLAVNGNVFVSGQQVIRGLSANDLPKLGNELLSSSNWTTTNWTGSYAGGWTHTAGNTTAISNTLAPSVGSVYLVSITVTGRTAGTFYVSMGGVLSNSFSASAQTGFMASSTATLSIVPTSTFDGTIVVSVKLVTSAGSNLRLQDSSGNLTFEFRGVYSNNSIFTGIDSGRYFFGSIGNNGNATAYGYRSAYKAVSAYNFVAVGAYAGMSNQISSGWVAVGYQAASSNIKGGNWVSIGMNSSLNGDTDEFVAIGYNCARYIADGSTPATAFLYCTYIGDSVRVSSNSAQNETAIGYAAIGSGSNTVTLGNTSILATFLRGNVNTILNKYVYLAASETADTVNDFRMIANGTNLLTQKCTVANAAKGGGTWSTVQTL